MKEFKATYILFILLFHFTLPGKIWAQNPIHIKNGSNVIEIDSSNFSPIKWFGKPGESSFYKVSNTSLLIRNPTTELDYWYTFSVINDDSIVENLVLVSYFYTPDEIDLIIEDQKGNKQLLYFRDTMSIYERLIEHKQPTFSFTLNPKETKKFYLKIKNESTYDYGFGIFSHFNFFSHYFREYLYTGVFYGLLVFVFFYSLINFIFFKDKVVLIYLLFIFSQLIHMLFRDGYGLYLLPEFAEHADLLKNLSRASISISILLYTLLFLKIPFKTIEFKLILIYIAARILFALYMLEATSKITFHFEFGAIIISTILSFRSYFKNDTDAKYLTIGLSALCFSYFIFYLSVVWFPSLGGIGYNLMYVGISMEFIFTTLALTERFKRIQLDNFKKDQMNKELEKTVKERTNLISLQNKLVADQSMELNQFLYSASHDLKGPLKSIEGLINLGKLDPEANHAQIYAMMYEKLQHLENNISDLNSVGKLKNADDHTERIHFEKLHNKLVKKFKKEVDLNSFTLLFQNQSTKEYFCDFFTLETIFERITDNALKFRDTSKNSYLKIEITEENAMLKLKFEDNGIGIEKYKIDSIFNIFYRGNEISRNDNGLGLYIVKIAVTKLHGTITVESTLGKGTTIFVQLPILPVTPSH